MGCTTFAVPPGALAFWEERFATMKVEFNRARRFHEKYVQFTDPDGLRLEIVEREPGALSRWSCGHIPLEQAIKGLGGAILYSVDPEKTQEVLQRLMGLEKVGQEGGLVRYRVAGDLGRFIDINVVPMPRGERGAGTVHHIAWRARNNDDLKKWREEVVHYGSESTAIIDRQCYDAIYFRERGGILFEIATDAQGIVSNEPFEMQGNLHPSWSVVHREFIESNLLPVKERALEEEIG